jgi:hypothetical protein
MFSIGKKQRRRDLCPVCGFSLESTASDFNICPSCGTEFGIDDVEHGVAELQKIWLLNGAQWASPVDKKPKNWEPFKQLEKLGTLNPATEATPAVIFLKREPNVNAGELVVTFT